MLIKDIKKEIVTQTEKAVNKIFKEKPKDLKLEIPPDIKFGDFAIGCFLLSKQFGVNANEIAKKISTEITASDIIEKTEVLGPYVNFRISKKVLVGGICSQIISQGSSFGNSEIGEDRRVMVEYLSPNTNKPLHLGHVRNGSIGMAVSNLLESTGHTVIKSNLINDRGIHICKSMLAWEKWANGTTPQSTKMKGDHFVGNWYVRYAQEAEKNIHLDEEIQEMLRDWEKGDKKTIDLWKMMNEWVYDGFAKTYAKLGFKFDVFYYESDTYKLGKDIVSKGLKEDVFCLDEKGNFVFDLSESEFGKNKDGSKRKVTVLRSDGTSLYFTQDLGTAALKALEHRLKHSIYVVGSEQNYHFKCLFKVLESMGYPWAKRCHHLSYGMVYLPEGKMKSREGKVVDADNLISEVEKLASNEIRKRYQDNTLPEKELRERAQKIGIGAIKFYLLRVHPSQNIHFDPEESVSFDGFTGPYCQYSYARAAGILNNAKKTRISPASIDFSLIDNRESLILTQKLMQFPNKIQVAVNEFNPSLVATNVFEIARAFNQFYHKNSVIKAETPELKKARLAIVKATSIVLKRGLNLLGIDVLEEM